MIDQLHAVPAGPGFDQVMVPGDPELINEAKAKERGVAVVASTYAYLQSGE